MPAVDGAQLNERRVAVDSPLVAGAQAELNGRRIGAGRADRAVRVGDRKAIFARAVADFRDWLPEVTALRIVVDQLRRIRLSALVPGSCRLHRQPVDDPGYQRRLDTLDEEILTVGVVENVADHT